MDDNSSSCKLENEFGCSRKKRERKKNEREEKEETKKEEERWVCISGRPYSSRRKKEEKPWVGLHRRKKEEKPVVGGSAPEEERREAVCLQLRAPWVQTHGQPGFGRHGSGQPGSGRLGSSWPPGPSAPVGLIFLFFLMGLALGLISGIFFGFSHCSGDI
jgi:hypothetical protein